MLLNEVAFYQFSRMNFGREIEYLYTVLYQRLIYMNSSAPTILGYTLFIAHNIC